MQIVHIAVLDYTLGGVNVAVPQHVVAQQEIADVAFVNLNNKKIEGIQNQLPYKEPFCGFPEPYKTPDLVIFHEIYRPSYLKISKYLKEKKIPYIICPHGGLTKKAQEIKWLKKKVANKLLFSAYVNGALGIQCLSAQELSNSIIGNNKFVAPNGVNISVKKETFSVHGINVVFVGRLDIYIKGLDLMLSAVESTSDFLRGNNVKILLCGPEENNSYDKLNTLICEKKISDIVSVRGAVLGKEKEEILLSADCFIQTSRSEGMSMGILEALGMGIPCLLTEGTGMASVVKNENAGWGCQNTADSIKEAFIDLVQNRHTLKEKSHNAMKLIEENYLWKPVAERTVEQYAQLLS